MPTKAWKGAERRTARLFNTRRNPLSGGNAGHSRSDSRHETLYIECKYSKRHAVWTLHDDTKAKAHKESKTPIIALHRKGSPGFIICVHSSNLDAFIAEYLKCQSPQPTSSGTPKRRRKRIKHTKKGG